MSRRRCGLLVSGILLGTLQQLLFNLAPVQQSGRLKLRDWEVEVSQGEGISAALSVHPMPGWKLMKDLQPAAIGFFPGIFCAPRWNIFNVPVHA